MSTDFDELTRYAKSFTGLTPEREALLVEVGTQIKPKLAGVTESFYRQLLAIPEAAAFIEGRVESLKKPISDGWKDYSAGLSIRPIPNTCTRWATHTSRSSYPSSSWRGR